jgi:ornithine cyclodeaminase
MHVRILSKDDVERALPARECIEVMATALGDLARGRVTQPLRSIVRPAGIAGAMALMPAGWASDDGPVLGLKIVCVFPGNRALGEDAHQGAVLLLSGQTGMLVSLLNASTLTAIRTAAVSALATRLLAREDAGDLALLGAGVQARAHLEAIAEVRAIRTVRVASRGVETARRFASELGPRYPFPIRAVSSAEEAVRGADIVVTATTSAEPVLKREWLRGGTHVNAVGSSVPSAREIDGPTVASSSLFVDRRESLLNESGDYLLALREGLVGPSCIRAEIGEVVIGAHPGRTSADEITLFKSLGLGIEDVAAARHAYRRAEAEGLGTRVIF